MDIMLTKRQYICDLICKHGEYDFLIDHITKSIDKYNKDEIMPSKFFQKMLCGRIGYDHNKKNAIFNLPTKELLAFTISLNHIINIDSSYELFAGTGIFTKCLEKTYKNSKFKKPTLFCSDAQNIEETSGYKFTDVTIKNFYEYLPLMSTRHTPIPNTRSGCIFIDPDVELFFKGCEYVNKFLDENKPKYLMIIGDKFLCKFNDFVSTKYKIHQIPLKLISCYDSIEDFGNTSQHSILLFVNNDDSTDINFVQTIFHHMKNQTFCKDQKFILNNYELTNDNIITKLVNNGNIPKFIKSFDLPLKEKLLSIFNKLEFKIKIQHFVDEDDFKFLIGVMIEHRIFTKFPKFKNKIKLEEFKSLYTKLNNDNLKEYIKIGIIDSDIIQKYIEYGIVDSISINLMIAKKILMESYIVVPKNNIRSNYRYDY